MYKYMLKLILIILTIINIGNLVVYYYSSYDINSFYIISVVMFNFFSTFFCFPMLNIFKYGNIAAKNRSYLITLLSFLDVILMFQDNIMIIALLILKDFVIFAYFYLNSEFKPVLEYKIFAVRFTSLFILYFGFFYLFAKINGSYFVGLGIMYIINLVVIIQDVKNEKNTLIENLLFIPLFVAVYFSSTAQITSGIDINVIILIIAIIFLLMASYFDNKVRKTYNDFLKSGVAGKYRPKSKLELF